MPVHLNHHILVDSAGNATVISQTIEGDEVPTKKLKRGDRVTFTSNRPDSEIRYKDKSPFPGQLAVGKRYKVSNRKSFQVEDPCDDSSPLVFECGHAVDRAFVSWGARRGRLKGGNTPGPDDIGN